MVLRTYSYGAVVKPRSTMERATRSGSRAHRLDDFRMARTARLVATGCARTNSRLPARTQQKYRDHERSSVLFMITCPILRFRRSGTSSEHASYASSFPSLKSVTDSACDFVTHVVDLFVC